MMKRFMLHRLASSLHAEIPYNSTRFSDTYVKAKMMILPDFAIETVPEYEIFFIYCNINHRFIASH